MRSTTGLLLASATYLLLPDRMLITGFDCGQEGAEPALRLVESLRDEARRNRVEEIWLDVRSTRGDEGLYERCGFKKRAFYREDPERPSSPLKSLWVLQRNAAPNSKGSGLHGTVNPSRPAAATR